MNSKLDKKENIIEKSFLSIFFTTFTTIFIAVKAVALMRDDASLCN